MTFPRAIGIALLCCLAASPSRSGVADRANPGEQAVRVMSFNLRLDTPADGPNAWRHRRDRVAEVIRAREVDLLGCQESPRRQIDDLVERLPEYDWYGVGREDGREAGEFSPVFYRRDRFERLDQATFWLSETPDKPGSRSWDASIPRIVSRVRLRDRQTGRVLSMFNTHFDHRGAQAREHGARLLLERIAADRGGDAVVLTGDFNCVPASVPYRILTTGTDQPDARGAFFLHDACVVSAHRHEGPDSTWNGFQSVIPHVRIDYIFVTDRNAVRRHAILDERHDGRFVSDHLPVLAELGFPRDNSTEQSP